MNILEDLVNEKVRKNIKQNLKLKMSNYDNYLNFYINYMYYEVPIPTFIFNLKLFMYIFSSFN